MSLHTQLLRGLFAIPATALITIAGLLSPQSPAIPCETEASVSLPRAEAAAGDARVLVVRREVAKR